MEIKKQQLKLKCDIPGCRNLAEFIIQNKNIFGNSKICFCSNCVKEIYEFYGKIATPKSPVNMLNKKRAVKNK